MVQPQWQLRQAQKDAQASGKTAYANALGSLDYRLLHLKEGQSLSVILSLVFFFIAAARNHEWSLPL